MIYHLIVLTVAAVAAFRGFRLGLGRQTPSLIGVAFGIVCARLLSGGMAEILYGAMPSARGCVEETFVYDTLANALVFVCIYAVFRTVTCFLSKVMHSKDSSILDNIGGALFGMFKYLLFLSIIFNVAVAINCKSELMKYMKSDDGNAVEEVMLLSPALLGGEDVEELAHKLQLEEAKKIS